MDIKTQEPELQDQVPPKAIDITWYNSKARDDAKVCREFRLVMEGIASRNGESVEEAVARESLLDTLIAASKRKASIPYTTPLKPKLAALS